MYEYKDFNDADSIRVVRLLPSEDFDSEIKCETEHTTLRSCHLPYRQSAPIANDPRIDIFQGERGYTGLSYV
jgi:hypothetical protein